MEIPQRLFVLFFVAVSLSAQPFYAGVKTGALLTSSTDTFRSTGRDGITDTFLELHRYSVGPSFEAALPARLRVETGLLYRNFDASQTTLFAGVTRTFTWLSDNRWEVPLALRREFASGAARPFAGAGGVWSHASRSVRRETISTLQDPPVRTAGQWSESDNLFGWTGSAGVRFRLPAGLKITPEIRYTRWTAKRWLPSQNQVDFFLGIGF